MTAFLKLCLARAGADAMITPREIIRDFCTVLNILCQNPEATFTEVVGQGVVTLSHAPGAGEDEDAFAAEDERAALDSAAAVQASSPVVQSKPAENAATNPDIPYKSDDFDFDLADLDI